VSTGVGGAATNGDFAVAYWFGHLSGPAPADLVQGATYRAGSGWTTHPPIDSGDDVEGLGGIAVDAHGRGFVIWRRMDETSGFPENRYAFVTGSTVSEVAGFADRGFGGFVSMSPRGSVAVVYRVERFVGGNYENRVHVRTYR
jgi:hypothetical protein